MPTRSLSRGRSRAGSPASSSHTYRTRSRSYKRSASPGFETRPGAKSRSPSSQRAPDRNGYRERSFSRSMSRGRDQSVARGGRWVRDRSYGRSPSPRNRRRSSKIVVEKLTKNVTEEHLFEIFGNYGEIQALDLPMNRAFMTNRGTAYILYYDVEDAEAAISHMHEAQLDGAVLNVSIVLPRRAFSRSPPPTRPGRGDESHSGHPRAQVVNNGRLPSGSLRRSPPRRFGAPRNIERHDIYRPRSLSRSRSPRRSRPYSPRSASRSLSRRREVPRRDSSRRRRRRSPSYSSYTSYNSHSSYSDRSRSPSRARGRGW